MDCERCTVTKRSQSGKVLRQKRRVAGQKTEQVGAGLKVKLQDVFDQLAGLDLERKPRQKIGKIAFRPFRHNALIHQAGPDVLDLVIVQNEKGLGLGVVNQRADHTADTTMLEQVREKSFRVIIIDSLLRHGSGDVGVLGKVAQAL